MSEWFDWQFAITRGQYGLTILVAIFAGWVIKILTEKKP